MLVSKSVALQYLKLTAFPAFLAAIDQTIAAVALPTIIHDIGGQSGYSWVGTAYLLGTLHFICLCLRLI